MDSKGKNLVIECQGYSLIMDSLKFHGSISDLLRQQTDQLLVLDSNMVEAKQEIDLLFQNKKLATKFENSAYLATTVSQQVNAGQNFNAYQSTLKLKDRKLILVAHEQTFLSKLIISIMLQKKYEVNLYNIHKYFSLIHLREKPHVDNSKTLNVFTCKARVQMTYAQFVEFLKLGSFKTADFLSTFFENINLEFKCWQNHDLKYIINVLDLNSTERKDSMGVYMLPIFTSDKKRDQIINAVVEQLPDKRIVAVQAFYEKNFSCAKAKENVEPVLVHINPKTFQSNFMIYAGANDLGDSNILFEDDEMIVEELTIDDNLQKRRLYFRENIHLIQSELKITDGKPDFAKLGLKVYKDITQEILKFAEKVGPDHQIKICMLGGGAACFANHLSNVLSGKSFDLTVVDINQKLKKIASDYFFFTESQNLRYSVTDAITFIKETQPGAFDIVIVDIDSKTDNSPPEIFLSPDFVRTLVKIVKQRHADGFIAYNCVYDNYDVLDKQIAPFKGEVTSDIIKHETKKNATLILK